MNQKMGSSLLGPFEKEGPVRRVERFLHSAGALPETYDVSFGVFEVGCEAHVSNWLLLPDHFAAQFLYVLQCSLDVRDVDCDDSVLDFVVALCQSAVDGSWFRRYLGLLVHLCSPNHVVLHSGVLADVPSEGFLVEALCAFLVVGRYLKVYDPSVMHISARARAAKGRCNKSSLYFSSLESLRPILDNVAARVCPAGSFCHS